MVVKTSREANCLLCNPSGITGLTNSMDTFLLSWIKIACVQLELDFYHQNPNILGFTYN